MDCSFVCKLFKGDKLLGTAFLIKRNILYTAKHNFKNVTNYDECYVVYKDETAKRYCFGSVNIVEKLDLAEIILDEEIPISNIPKIATECIDEEEKLSGYGYRKTDEVIGVLVKLEKYNELLEEIADNCFMIKDEEDGVKWNGISGGPVFSESNVRGIIIKNYGGDGLKTRIKVISFNKIINYLIEENRVDMIENFPQEYLLSELNKRISKNRELCNKLYYNSYYEFEKKSVDFRLSFLKVEEDRTVDIKRYSDEIRKTIEDYALTLDDRYSGSKKEFWNIDKIQKICKRIEEVKRRIEGNFTSAYIILWILSEGIMNIPRVGRVLVERNYEYYEEDIYFKKRDERITLLIPIISVYEDLFLSLESVINSISEKNDGNLIELSGIEWDGKAIECLDYKSQSEIGKIIRNEYRKEINIEITALVVYNSRIYDNIPSVINNEERISKYFANKFKQGITDNIEKYNGLLELSSNIDKIKVNLFVLPISEINIIANI